MNIAVLSGKGGTGKTLLSVNLASVAEKSTYIDCDVEEPNGHLFFKPENIKSKKVSVWIPMVDEKLCNGCRICVDFCKFNALAYIKNSLFVFDEICHSCGGCVYLCPQGALSEKANKIGEIQEGTSKNVEIITGILNPGEASGVPIIKELLKHIESQHTDCFIDCPPGSACVVMESIKDADYCVLVAEPTIFGSHNLAMVYELVQLFKIPHGVVLNKCQDDGNPSELFCEENNIPIIGRIPFDRDLGILNSNALIAANENEKYHSMFSNILQRIRKEVLHETTINS